MARSMGERQRWAWLAAGTSAVAATSLCGISWIWVLLGVGTTAVLSLWWDRTIRPAGLAPMLPHSFGVLGRIWAAVCAVFAVAALACAPIWPSGPFL